MKIDDINEKYLSRVLESATNGLEQAEEALKQLDAQRESVLAQKEEMEDAVSELTELLGLNEKDESDGE
jgi:DNA repair exonuclease SbcCD ATPase subunit